MKRHFFLILIFILLQSFCSSQVNVDYKIVIDSTQLTINDDSSKILEVYYMTKNNYRNIQFGKEFNNDSIKVFQNDKKIMDALVTTNHSIDMYDKYCGLYLENKNRIKIISNNNYFIFEYLVNYLFLRIDFDNGYTLTYTNYPYKAK